MEIVLYVLSFIAGAVTAYLLKDKLTKTENKVETAISTAGKDMKDAATEVAILSSDIYKKL